MWGRIEPISQCCCEDSVSKCRWAYTSHRAEVSVRVVIKWQLLVSCHWSFPIGLCSPPLPESQLNIYSHCLNSSPSTSHPSVLLQGNPIRAAPVTFAFRVRKGCLSCLDPEATPRFSCFASNWVTDRQTTASVWPRFFFCTIVGCHALQSHPALDFSTENSPFRNRPRLYFAGKPLSNLQVPTTEDI